MSFCKSNILIFVSCLIVRLVVLLVGLFASLQVSAQTAEPARLVYSSPDDKIRSFLAGSEAVIDIRSNLSLIAHSDARVVGAILLSAYWQVKLALEPIPPNTNLYVRLESDGGDQNQAQLITDIINDRCSMPEASCQITTYVGTTCSSACIYMFKKIGTLHTASADARFGFHATRYVSNTKVRLASEDETIGHYVSAGVNEEWLRKIQQAGVFSSVEMTYFSAQEMLSIGYIDTISSSVPVDFSPRGTSTLTPKPRR